MTKIFQNFFWQPLKRNRNIRNEGIYFMVIDFTTLQKFMKYEQYSGIGIGLQAKFGSFGFFSAFPFQYLIRI